MGRFSWPLTEALLEQGKLWRAVLTGEMQAEDVLDPLDYINAASRLPARMWGMTKPILTSFKERLKPADKWKVALGVVATVVVLFLLGKTSGLLSSFIGAFLAIGGTLLATRSVSKSMRAARRRVDDPLWDAELGETIAAALTRLPEGSPLPTRDTSAATDG